jgi:hypothetical protein
VTGLKTVRWTPHAVERLAEHQLERDAVLLTIEAPKYIALGDPPRKVHMRRHVDAALGQAMLLRVVIEETSTELVVLTVYRTSKIDKYLRGFVP